MSPAAARAVVSASRSALRSTEPEESRAAWLEESRAAPSAEAPPTPPSAALCASPACAAAAVLAPPRLAIVSAAERSAGATALPLRASSFPSTDDRLTVGGGNGGGALLPSRAAAAAATVAVPVAVALLGPCKGPATRRPGTAGLRGVGTALSAASFPASPLLPVTGFPAAAAGPAASDAAALAADPRLLEAAGGADALVPLLAATDGPCRPGLPVPQPLSNSSATFTAAPPPLPPTAAATGLDFATSRGSASS